MSFVNLRDQFSVDLAGVADLVTEIFGYASQPGGDPEVLLLIGRLSVLQRFSLEPVDLCSQGRQLLINVYEPDEWIGHSEWADAALTRGQLFKVTPESNHQQRGTF